ncbi:MAG: NTP transferase domain-containing protein, partial [Candidatus Paceibacterales bacterium]
VEVFLSKRKDQKAYKPFDCIIDSPEFENHGPLGGILSAMKAYPNADWLVIACDLPFITDGTIRSLLSHRDPQKQATVFISTQDALPEPLCAIWEGHAFDFFLKLFNEGIHCPRKILIKSNTHLLDPTDPHWLGNINTPEDYEKAF